MNNSNDLSKLWDQLIENYDQKHSNPLFYNDVLLPTKFLKTTNNNCYILVKSNDHINFLNTIKLTLENKLREISGENYKLIFVDKIIPEKIELTNELDTETNFENYIIGNFNKNAYKLINDLSENGTSNYSPIFIYSRTGLGKTHLLNAGANKYNRNFPNNKLHYVNANTFLAEVLQILNSKNINLIEAFKNEYSNLDVLIIDDVQHLSDKQKTNEILFTIFNNLIIKKKIVILSSDRSPYELNGFEDRMISRFSSGISCKINEPEIESIHKIITNALNTTKINLSEDAMNVISDTYNSDIRSLLGVLNKIVFFHDCNETTTINNNQIKDILEIQNIANGQNKKISAIRPNAIIDRVAKIYNVKSSEIENNSRKQNIVLARHIVMYIMREYGHYQLKEIGSFLGNRDHTTVLNGVEKIKGMIMQDKEFANLINSIIKQLN